MTQAENLRRLILSPDPVNRQIAATILQGLPELKAEVFPNIPETLPYPLMLVAWNRPENWGYIHCWNCKKRQYRWNKEKTECVLKCSLTGKPTKQCTPCRESDDSGLPF